MLRLLRSHPSTTSVLHNESWCISKMNSCRNWLTNHRRFNFTTRNVQTLKLLLTCFVMRLQMKFLLLITWLQKYLYILNGLLNWPSQLIHQYFIRQLVQVSLFTNNCASCITIQYCVVCIYKLTSSEHSPGFFYSLAEHT